MFLGKVLLFLLRISRRSYVQEIGIFFHLETPDLKIVLCAFVSTFIVVEMDVSLKNKGQS
ncbi:Uncharacterized protein BN1224_CV14_A_02400 [Chlamydia pneumoniae]|uniref:Uncharacterized protein n=1 Tax=Chlamydia pneumoniae TaxID=83558 RepID=Q9Z8V1_CHLPN|nr:hypothetical protein CPn_0233 [Chlamydia pneumoniae CWL029]AAF38355.1 hypothetical protein CP_0531 [Chlamydia pneumoniae AR39]CRI32732.1 Uncharacterized protein BN1224_Wien1_A_02390 [Chlamydia pneumoniae]BAA98443.1 hypothetical protein [Chlamydia pneumoniae J138]CRI35595.1 Uncharacterized protein BN1224_CM1_A_02420 [Chlamydia pneumoniae]